MNLHVGVGDVCQKFFLTLRATVRFVVETKAEKNFTGAGGGLKLS